MPQRVSLRQLLEVRDYFRENPAGRVRLRSIWPNRTLDAAGWRGWFVDCLNAKINAHLPNHGRGRNWDSERQIQLWRDSRRVRDILTRRLRVYQFETAAARSRFSHLLASHDD